MTTSSLIIDFLGEGLAASRPASLTINSAALGIYYATDTKVVSLWNGSGWDTLSGGGSGTVTEIVAAGLLTGGTITTAGTIGLAAPASGIVVSNGTTISAGSLSGGLAFSGGTLSLDAATGSVQGGVVIGSGLAVSGGTVSNAGIVELQQGTISADGTIEVGSGLTLSSGGTLSAAGGGGGITQIVASGLLTGGTITSSGTIGLLAPSAGVVVSTGTSLEAAVLVGLTLSGGNTLTAPGGSLVIEQAGTSIVASAGTINFASGATVTGSGSTANIAISGGGSLPTIIQKTFARAASTSVTATLGTAPTPGNYMVAILSGAASGGSASFAAPAGWLKVMNAGFSSFEQFGVFIRQVQSGDGTSYIFTSGVTTFNVAIYETSPLVNVTFQNAIPTFGGTGITTVTGTLIGQNSPTALRLYTLENDNSQTSITSSTGSFTIDHFYGNDGINHAAIIGEISPNSFFGVVTTIWAGTVADAGDMQVSLWG